MASGRNTVSSDGKSLLELYLYIYLYTEFCGLYRFWQVVTSIVSCGFFGHPYCYLTLPISFSCIRSPVFSKKPSCPFPIISIVSYSSLYPPPTFFCTNHSPSLRSPPFSLSSTTCYADSDHTTLSPLACPIGI